MKSTKRDNEVRNEVIGVTNLKWYMVHNHGTHPYITTTEMIMMAKKGRVPLN